ncbi:hypothetical protein KXJ74_07290 [Acinetobacter johnsonii]|jgi:hypothetical protein|nr:hypothetical protein KXJ74_07290 [Acinetobacter johnsonii]
MLHMPLQELRAIYPMPDNQHDHSTPLLLTYNPNYNWVYKRLVSSENDLVGAIAYVLYKEHKIEFILKIEADTGSDPSSEQLRAFHQQSCLDSSLAGFQNRAQGLVNEFLRNALTSHAEYIESQADQRMEERVKLATQSLEEQITVLQNTINTNHQLVTTEIINKKGILNRLGEAFLNILYGLAIIAIVGGVFNGYKWISSLNNAAENASGINK